MAGAASAQQHFPFPSFFCCRSSSTSADPLTLLLCRHCCRSHASCRRQRAPHTLRVSCPAVEQDTEMPSTSGRPHSDSERHSTGDIMTFPSGWCFFCSLCVTTVSVESSETARTQTVCNAVGTLHNPLHTKPREADCMIVSMLTGSQLDSQMLRACHPGLALVCCHTAMTCALRPETLVQDHAQSRMLLPGQTAQLLLPGCSTLLVHCAAYQHVGCVVLCLLLLQVSSCSC